MRKILLLFFLLLSLSLQAQTIIEDYQRIFLPVYTEDGNLLIAIRVFKMNNVASFLVVHPNSLDTQVIPISHLDVREKQQKKAGYFTHWNVESTLYYQFLNKYTAAPYPLQNKGVTQAERMIKGNVLTIDLCPSSKPFEKNLFNNLVQLAEETGQPIPVTIAISGLWLVEHPEEFQWLIKQKMDHKLAITWANHSFSHAFYADLPYSKNFLLLPHTNLELELLLTEKYLLEAGELPSVFFRFPGLVSNKKLIQTLEEYGLIPLSTNAWLAKNQSIEPGSIILIHGNGNEPQGVGILLPLLRKLTFFDLKAVFIKD